MKARQGAPNDIDAYIADFPAEVQGLLEAVRRTIRKAAPVAKEKISYQIPIFTLKGKNLIHFAAFKKHIGVYPAPVGEAGFDGDLSGYAAGKATVRFPLDKPLPFDLIREIVRFRVKEASDHESARPQKRKRGPHA